MGWGSAALVCVALVACGTSADETVDNPGDPVGVLLSFAIDGSLRDEALPFEVISAEVQTAHSDAFIVRSGDHVLVIALRSTPGWSTWDGAPYEFVLGPLRVSATSVVGLRGQLPDFDSVLLAYNDPLGTAVEMTASDFEAYGLGRITDQQALDRMVLSGTP